MSIAPLTFTGVSTYSSDLQTVLNRAVQIAQLPLTALQNQDTDVLQRKTLVSDLSQPLTDLGNAVAALGQLASSQGLAASSSDSSVVSVTGTGAKTAAVYTVSNVTSLARAASETSTTGYASSTATPVSSTGSMRLVVGSNNYDFSLSTNNLVTLRDRINSLGAGVSASILTTSGGNYLSLSASSTGATTLRLLDDPTGAATNRLTSANQGTNAVFQLNGIPISRSSNVVNDVVPGLTFTLNDTTTSGQSVQLTLATDRSQLGSALQTFATAYNAVVDKVNAQVGPNAGLLSGDFLVREVQSDLRSLGNYQSGGTVKSLTDLGINFAANGKMSVDTSTLNSLSDSQVNAAFTFLGSSSTGFGALAAKFTQLTDPITGLIKIQQDSYDTTDRRLQAEISDMTTKINSMQTALSSRLQMADSLLATLQAQQTQVSSSVQSLNYVLYGKQTTG